MSVKKLIITCIFIAVIVSAVAWFLSYIYVPPILMYHSIDENEGASKICLSPEGFARQMEFLHKRKYNVIPVEKMVGLIKYRKKVPHKTISITFDDGYRNNFLIAYPILKNYGFPAAIFVPTSMIGKEGYLTWDDIEELIKNNIDIESHSVSHPCLPDLNDAMLRNEVFDSKRILELRLKNKVRFFAYPLGKYDERVKEMVKNAGYEAAFATTPGRSKNWRDIYALKRIRMSRTSNNIFVFWLKTSGYYTFIKEMRDED